MEVFAQPGDLGRISVIAVENDGVIQAGCSLDVLERCTVIAERLIVIGEHRARSLKNV